MPGFWESYAGIDFVMALRTRAIPALERVARALDSDRLSAKMDSIEKLLVEIRDQLKEVNDALREMGGRKDADPPRDP